MGLIELIFPSKQFCLGFFFIIIIVLIINKPQLACAQVSFDNTIITNMNIYFFFFLKKKHCYSTSKVQTILALIYIIIHMVHWATCSSGFGVDKLSCKSGCWWWWWWWVVGWKLLVIIELEDLVMGLWRNLKYGSSWSWPNQLRFDLEIFLIGVGFPKEILDIEGCTLLVGLKLLLPSTTCTVNLSLAAAACVIHNHKHVYFCFYLIVVNYNPNDKNLIIIEFDTNPYKRIHSEIHNNKRTDLKL